VAELNAVLGLPVEADLINDLLADPGIADGRDPRPHG